MSLKILILIPPLFLVFLQFILPYFIHLMQTLCFTLSTSADFYERFIAKKKYGFNNHEYSRSNKHPFMNKGHLALQDGPFL